MPTAGIIDSQSVKTAEKRGKSTVTMAENLYWDASALIRVDTLGLLLAVVVTEANFPERLGGAVVVMEAAQATDNLMVIWVDQGFSGKNFERVIQQLRQ